MSRAERDSSDKFSLFPFLAVLLCLMGALLVLLTGLAKADNQRLARAQAAREAAVAGEASKSESADQLAEIDQYSAQLETVRAKAAERLRSDQARLSYLEEHMRRLKDELGTLQIAALELEAMASEHTDDRAQAQSELDRVNRLSKELEQRIEELQEELRGKGKSYAIVPYHGRNGTHRPTIYIECRGDRAILQPEGVEFKASDFRGPMGAGNPLAAALRAAREYFAKQKGAGGDDLEPYPLILVRPDGINAYADVRRAIRGWEADFGYELVDGDWDLTYPPPNPELARIEQQAMEDARARLRMLVEAAPRAYGSAGGLFDSEEDGVGESGGQYGGPTNGADGSGGSVPNAEVAVGGTANSGSNSHSPGDVGVHGGLSPGGQPDFIESVATASPSAGGAEGPELTAADGNGHAASGRLGGGGGPETLTTDGTYAVDDGNTPQIESDESGDTTFARQPGGRALTPPGNSGGGSQSGGSNMNSQPNSSTQVGAGGGHQFRQIGMQSAAAGDSHVAPQMTASGPSGDASGASTSFEVTPKPSRNRGKDWAIRDTTPANVAIRRTVQVMVRSEELAILPDQNQTSAIAQVPAGSVVSMNAHQAIPIEKFVLGLWNYMEQWGIAGNGLYWKPVLVLNVAPGGEQRAAELTQLLRNSGVEVRTSDTAQRTDQPSHAMPR